MDIQAKEILALSNAFVPEPQNPEILSCSDGEVCRRYDWLDRLNSQEIKLLGDIALNGINNYSFLLERYNRRLLSSDESEEVFLSMEEHINTMFAENNYFGISSAKIQIGTPIIYQVKSSTLMVVCGAAESLKTGKRNIMLYPVKIQFGQDGEVVVQDCFDVSSLRTMSYEYYDYGDPEYPVLRSIIPEINDITNVFAEVSLSNIKPTDMLPGIFNPRYYFPVVGN